MSVCSLFGNGVSVSLDVVSDVTYSRSGQPTTSTIFNGAKISDHYRPDLPTLNIQGVVTAIKTKATSNYLTPEEFDTFINTLMDSQSLLTFIGTEDQAIKDMSNVVISAYTETRNVKYSDSLKITLTLQQLDISNSVKKTVFTDPLIASNSSKISIGKTTEIKGGSLKKRANEIKEKTAIKAYQDLHRNNKSYLY